MDRAERQIDALIFADHGDFVVAGYIGASGDHHPMFGPVVVFLQRQFLAWPHDDALHLEAVAQK